jgi:imidazolonepropionase-like amidohydrolase
MAAAHEAGVPIYAGTDAGSRVAHGRIADEIEALKGIGMSPVTSSATPTTRGRAPRCSTTRMW